jgi:hypothetical protein
MFSFARGSDHLGFIDLFRKISQFLDVINGMQQGRDLLVMASELDLSLIATDRESLPFEDDRWLVHFLH